MSSYVALGDSYAAGVGAGERRGEVYRTDAGYPLEVSRRTGLDLAYQAVLGATIEDVLRDQVPALGPQTELVTITVGGNDIGFVPVLLEVVRPAWASDSERAIAEARTLLREVLPARLRMLLAEVRGRAPRAELLVTGYPRLFNGVSDCSLLTFVTVAEMRALADAADELAETILSAADDAGVRGVDVRDPFDGHQICDEPAWLHGLSWPVEESYHPNGAGHRGYADVVAGELGSGALEADTGVEPRAESGAQPEVVDGACAGSAPPFRLPDVLSSRSLAGAAEAGLDADEIARLGRIVRDEARDRGEREAAAEVLQARHAQVVGQ